jgi:DNA helicase HerA-like ATPase
VLYDSKDLVTHGVVLGMTGSGKTGLCLALLEEAAIDGMPLIAIDPKGDHRQCAAHLSESERRGVSPVDQ